MTSRHEPAPPAAWPRPPHGPARRRRRAGLVVGGALPLALLDGGNQRVEREGITHLYRHGLTYRWSVVVPAEGLFDPNAPDWGW